MEVHPAKYAEIAKLLTPRITPILKRFGFSMLCTREWTRRWGWKQDLIDLLPLPGGILINLYVMLPCYGNTEGESGYETLVVEGLGHVAGCARPDFQPSFLESRRRFASRVATALDRGMAWFDAFDTRTKCIQYLHASENKPGCPSFIAMNRYLESLPRLLDVPCCLLKPGV